MTITAILLLVEVFWAANGVYVMAILFAVSEILAMVPKVKENSMLEFLLKFIMLVSRKG
jgi:hypothetical protein